MDNQLKQLTKGAERLPLNQLIMRNSQRVRAQRWSVKFQTTEDSLVIESDFWSVADAKNDIERKIGIRISGINKIVD